MNRFRGDKSNNHNMKTNENEMSGRTQDDADVNQQMNAQSHEESQGGRQTVIATTASGANSLSHDCSVPNDGQAPSWSTVDHDDVKTQRNTDRRQPSWSNVSQAPVGSSLFGPRGGARGQNKQIELHQYNQPHNMSKTVNSDYVTNDSTANLTGSGDYAANQDNRSSTAPSSFNTSKRQIYRKGIINLTNKRKLPQARNHEGSSTNADRASTYLSSLAEERNRPSYPAAIAVKAAAGPIPIPPPTTATIASEQMRMEAGLTHRLSASPSSCRRVSSTTEGSLKGALDMYYNMKPSPTQQRSPSFQQYRQGSINSPTATDASSIANTSAIGYEDDERLSQDPSRDIEDDLHTLMTSNTSNRINYKRQRANEPHHHHGQYANSLTNLNNNHNDESLSERVATNATAAHLASLSIQNIPDSSYLPPSSQASVVANRGSRFATSLPNTFPTATTSVVPPATTDDTSTIPNQLNHLSHLGNPPIQLEDQRSLLAMMNQDSIEREQLRAELLHQAHRYRQLSDQLVQHANSNDLNPAMLLPLLSAAATTTTNNLPLLLSSLPLTTSGTTQQQHFHNNLSLPMMSNNMNATPPHAIAATTTIPAAGLGAMDEANRFNTNAFAAPSSAVEQQQRRNETIDLSRTDHNRNTNINTNNHLTNAGASSSLSQLLQQIDGMSSTTGTASNEGGGGSMMPSLAATTTTGRFHNSSINNDDIAKMPAQNEWSGNRIHHMNNVNMMPTLRTTIPYAIADGNVFGGDTSREDTNTTNAMPSLAQNKEAYGEASFALDELDGTTKITTTTTTGASNNIITPGQQQQQQQQRNEEVETEVVEHHSTRSYVPLGNEEFDKVWLSDFLVFLRSKCIEVFEASSQLVKERNRYKQVFINQVGLRCRFCAHLPYSERGKRSSSFPQTQCRIYQSVTMMIRDHFRVCKEIPNEIRKEYDKKKAATRRGELEAKQYWVESSKTLGLVDTQFGIFYQNKLLKDDFQSRQEMYKKV